ncbi:MAG: type VII secretion system ESX-4 subunit EccD4, partial [Mycobacterium sp.]
TILLATFSSSAAAGAIATALGGTPRPDCIAFAAMTGVALLLRGQPIRRRTLVCIINGITTTATTLSVAAVSGPQRGPWIAAATASLVALACVLGFVTPTMSASPIVTRSVELLECLALITMVPLTCWICGLYVAARDLHLAWG